MANILMGWEMGTGFGHVVPLLAVARRLSEHGHRPVLALRDVVEPASLLREDAFPVLQAPVWQPPPQRRTPATATLADIFAVTGFGDRDRIHSIVTAWEALIDLVRPELVVAEFSPGLCLAARGRVPVVAIGSGFCLPPSEMEAFPSLQPNVKPLVRQQDLLATVNAVQGDRDAPPLSGLPAMFDADGQFVFALPILDPYAAFRAEPADGPLESLPEAAPPPSEPHVYVYYGMELPGVKPLMDGLGKAGLPATVYLRGAPPGLLRRLARPGIRFLDSPPRYGDILPRCSVAVHYASLATTAACLGAGRPQLTLPR
ncbi:MAG: hypothetical protein V3S59_02055, partial [Alphaproteobacteria bacterium]